MLTNRQLIFVFILASICMLYAEARKKRNLLRSQQSSLPDKDAGRWSHMVCYDVA